MWQRFFQNPIQQNRRKIISQNLEYYIAKALGPQIIEKALTNWSQTITPNISQTKWIKTQIIQARWFQAWVPKQPKSNISTHQPVKHLQPIKV